MASFGYRLLHEKGLRQGTYFSASSVDLQKRQQWIDSRCDASRRNWSGSSRIQDHNLLVVISQDCDISCNNDSLDPLIELAVCTPCRSPYPGNTYASSARLLHFDIDDTWYEAKASNLIHVRKDDLWESLDTNNLQKLPDPACMTFPQWRALRFTRSALPDAFNNVFRDHIDELTSQLDSLGRQHIRAIYIWLDSYDETIEYKFELLALLHEDAPDEVVSQAIDHVEQFVEKLESEDNLTANEGDHVIFACRTDQIWVNDLLRFVRINLDHISLREGDDQVDVDTGA